MIGWVVINVPNYPDPDQRHEQWKHRNCKILSYAVVRQTQSENKIAHVAQYLAQTRLQSNNTNAKFI